MQEAEQIVRPLEEVFNRISVENFRNDGVKGIIPTEISKDELIHRAQELGYIVHDIDLSGVTLDNEVVLVTSEGKSVGLYTKPGATGEAIYVLDDEFETFKEMFFEGAVR